MAAIFASQVTVANAETAQQVTTSAVPVLSVHFEFSPDNSGSPKVYVGGSDVSSTVHGFALDGTLEHVFRRMEFPVGNPGKLSDFWVDADTNGTKVNVMAVTLT